jgi:MYXO-CTERM domain-containing protein
MSPDNRWAYTLYAADEPFVHALDTVNKTAVCIDLDGLDGTDVSAAKLTLDGPTLHVGGLAAIDTRTYKVSADPIATPTPRATATPAPVKHEDGSSPWPFVAIGLVALGLVALVVRRRRSVHDVVDLQVTVDHPDEEPALRQ